MYLIGTGDTRENAIVRTMYHGPDGLERMAEGDTPPSNDDGTPCDKIVWGLRALRGRDQMKIQNESVEMDTKRGTAKMMTGNAVKSRILGSIVFVDGLAWANGVPIEGVNERVYADLPVWMINRLGAWVDDINRDSDEAKKEELGE